MCDILIKMQRFRIAYTSDTISLYIKKYEKGNLFSKKISRAGLIIKFHETAKKLKRIKI